MNPKLGKIVRPLVCWSLAILLVSFLTYVITNLVIESADNPEQLLGPFRKHVTLLIKLLLGFALCIPLFIVLKIVSVIGRIPAPVEWILPLTKYVSLGVISLCLGLYAGSVLAVYHFPITQHGSVGLGTGNIVVPSKRTLPAMDREEYVQRAILPDSTDMLSRLAAGREIEALNESILSQEGSVHFQFPEFVMILYRFGDQPERLYPETRKHIVQKLMPKGGDPVVWNPMFHNRLPLRYTENLILTSESSRFLTNQWIAQHGDSDPAFDNAKNGLEQFLLTYLNGIERAGFFEYNSTPYLRYTFVSLLNLEAFATDPVASTARRILDRMSWDYALGSQSFRRLPPFRRQPRKAGWTALSGDHSGSMRALVSRFDGLENPHEKDYSLWVGLTGYQLPDAVAQWAISRPEEYFVRIGHGSDGSPEIYSGGPGYLITAGGVANGFMGQNVARPTTLMLEDGATWLKELLYVTGPGSDVAKDFRKWNNTGVHHRFAVAAGPVHVPEGWEPSASDGAWSIYERAGQTIGVYSTDTLGLFCLLRKGDNREQLQQLIKANPDEMRLQRRFAWPDGAALDYDVHADKNRWVISAVNGNPVDRSHGIWPLMAGEVPGYGEGSDKGVRN